MGREDEPFPVKGWPLTLLPRSLYGRSLLIIILPIAVMQIIVTYVFFTAHWDTVTARMSEGVAGEVALTVDLYREDPTAARAAELEEMLLRTSDLSVVLQRGDSLPDTTRSNVFSNLDRTLADALEERIDRPHWFDTTRYPNHIDIRVGVEEGVLRFIAAKERVFAPTGLAFVLLLLAATLALTLVSIVFTRNQAKPIVALAEPPTPTAGAATSRASRPAGRARGAKPGTASRECSGASPASSSSAQPCWRASATTSAPRSRGSSYTSPSRTTARKRTPPAATSRRWRPCWTAISTSPAATAWRRARA